MAQLPGQVVDTRLCCCRSLVALLVAAPQAAGAALLPHFTGSHLDTGQRLLVLDAMGAPFSSLLTLCILKRATDNASDVPAACYDFALSAPMAGV